MEENIEDPSCCRRSFAASLRDTAKRLLQNPGIVTRAVARERLDICESCDRYMRESMQCSICMCIMPVKTTFSNMRCPIDKWQEWKREEGTRDENEN